MIIKKFVVGDMGNNNYLLIDNGEAVLIDCTALIPELDSVLKEYDAKLKYILLTPLRPHKWSCCNFKNT